MILEYPEIGEHKKTVKIKIKIVIYTLPHESRYDIIGYLLITQKTIDVFRTSQN